MYSCFQFLQFPFDQQECQGTIDLPWKNNNTVALTPSETPIIYEGSKTLTTFTVKDLSAYSEITPSGSSFNFKIKLKRIWASFFITTFLQTFVLWFLVYLTLFIDIKDFNNRFMGAITGFLVFASLLSSLMSSLPQSSSFKLADLWLLFFMFNIIIVIIMHILIEYLQRRNTKDDLVQNKLKYPEEVVIIKCGHRSNSAAKAFLPIITTLFMVIYFMASTININIKI